MPISVTIPTLGKPKNVKDAVIAVLTNEWPLSARKIYNKVRNMGLNVSYQAVHKAVCELLESGMLIKRDKSYELNIEWLDKIGEFGNKFGTIYKTGQKRSLEDLIEKCAFNLNFKTFKEFADFCMSAFLLQCPNPENKIGICNFSHIYPLIGHSDKIYRDMKNFFTEHKFYSIIKYDTPLDLWFADFFRKFGKKIKLGVNFVSVYDTIVVGDHVMQIFFTKEFREKLNSIYESAKNIMEINLDRLIFQIRDDPTEINVVIFRNSKVADQIRNDTLEHFKR